MPSARGMALVKAHGIECKPLLIKPVPPSHGSGADYSYTFVHRCAGPGCAICAWVEARPQRTGEK